MNELYPLKFEPIYKEKIWGGNKLANYLNKNVTGNQVGESWEVSGVADNISVVSEGFLAGNDLQELIEIYMGDLVGEKVYEKFGVEFPVLVKFIDANKNLSIQVHPNDETAKERHKAYGKTEMWYVLDAEENAEIIIGFNRQLDKKEYLQYFENGKLEKILNHVKVKKGDVFFLPAGRIHSIGAGVLLAEIQQTSDITYRIYDWERTDTNGNKRELHTDLAKDSIDFTFYKNYYVEYPNFKNITAKAVSCEHFTTNILEFDQAKKRIYVEIDSFVVIMCIEGKFTIEYGNNGETVEMKKGETVLIPAEIELLNLVPKGEAKILETYINL